MSNKAPWPVRKGIFRSSGQTDPSPVVEMPNTPTPQPGRTSNPLSPLINIVESPFSPPQSPCSTTPMSPTTTSAPTPTSPMSPTSPTSPMSPTSPISPTSSVNKSIRYLPIEVQHEWPEAEELPEDMRTVCHFNGVRWIHDYQDACVDKLERFMRGERDASLINCSYRGNATPSTPSTASTNL